MGPGRDAHVRVVTVCGTVVEVVLVVVLGAVVDGASWWSVLWSSWSAAASVVVVVLVEVVVVLLLVEGTVVVVELVVEVVVDVVVVLVVDGRARRRGVRARRRGRGRTRRRIRGRRGRRSRGGRRGRARGGRGGVAWSSRWCVDGRGGLLVVGRRRPDREVDVEENRAGRRAFNDSAVRVPVVPATMMTIGRPLTQPPTVTMSWMIDAMLGLRCAAPAAPTVVHPGIVHATECAVRVRLEMLLAVSAKVKALLLA